MEETKPLLFTDDVNKVFLYVKSPEQSTGNSQINNLLASCWIQNQLIKMNCHIPGTNTLQQKSYVYSSVYIRKYLGTHLNTRCAGSIGRALCILKLKKGLSEWTAPPWFRVRKCSVVNISVSSKLV